VHALLQIAGLVDHEDTVEVTPRRRADVRLRPPGHASIVPYFWQTTPYLCPRRN
jgi:hypothetical protein